MNRLVLIDGNAILHRAYHALPPLTAPDGSVVNAVYGFTSILFKLFSDLKPTHMAVAFDRPEPTFRKKMLVSYQAQRPEMEDALVSQVGKVQDMVRAFGIPIYDAAGFEADDVIGTVCRLVTSDKKQETSKKGNLSLIIDEVVIVTGDRDILQLVDDTKGIQLFMPTKGLSEGKLYSEKDVVERMGVSPSQIPDLKALMGDASDNYPGVVGIGPKTAAYLVQSFKSVESLYKEVENGKSNKIKVSVIEKLVSDKKNAYLSKDLATIRTNAPVNFDSKFARVATLDTPEARGMLEKFHFPSLIKRLTEYEQLEKKPQKKEKKKQPDSLQLSLV